MSTQRFKTVSTSALTSRKLAQIDADAERLFWRVYFASDSFGTMSGDPWDVLQKAVPSVRGFDTDVVSAALDTLVGARLIERWQEGDQAWIHVTDHDRHQSAYWKSKRGARHTPIPPSQRKDAPEGSAPETNGSAPETSAPHAEVSPALPPRYPLDVGVGEEVGAGAGNGGMLTTFADRAREGAHAHEAGTLPPNQRSPEARIRQAQRDLGSHAATYVLNMIARRNGASDSMLSATDEFDRYWRPACVLLSEHGTARLRAAIDAKGAATATSIEYVRTIAGRLMDEHAAQQATTPDLAGSELDGYTPTIATSPGAAA